MTFMFHEEGRLLLDKLSNFEECLAPCGRSVGQLVGSALEYSKKWQEIV
jgi:hypothetical protein